MPGPYRIQAWDEMRCSYADVSIRYDRWGPADWAVAGDKPATEFTDWEDAIQDMMDLPVRAIYCCIDIATRRRFFDDNGAPDGA